LVTVQRFEGGIPYAPTKADLFIESEWIGASSQSRYKLCVWINDGDITIQRVYQNAKRDPVVQQQAQSKCLYSQYFLERFVTLPINKQKETFEDIHKIYLESLNLLDSSTKEIFEKPLVEDPKQWIQKQIKLIIDLRGLEMLRAQTVEPHGASIDPAKDFEAVIEDLNNIFTRIIKSVEEKTKPIDDKSDAILKRIEPIQGGLAFNFLGKTIFPLLHDIGNKTAFYFSRFFEVNKNNIFKNSLVEDPKQWIQKQIKLIIDLRGLEMLRAQVVQSSDVSADLAKSFKAVAGDINNVFARIIKTVEQNETPEVDKSDSGILTNIRSISEAVLTGLSFNFLGKTVVILLHEMGHKTAFYFLRGDCENFISLTPFGGLHAYARNCPYSSLGTSIGQDYADAIYHIAGPLVNVAILTLVNHQAGWYLESKPLLAGVLSFIVFSLANDLDYYINQDLVRDDQLIGDFSRFSKNMNISPLVTYAVASFVTSFFIAIQFKRVFRIIKKIPEGPKKQKEDRLITWGGSSIGTALQILNFWHVRSSLLENSVI